MCYTLRKNIAKTLDQVFTDGYIAGSGYPNKPPKTLKEYEDDLVRLVMREIFGQDNRGDD